MRNALAVYHFWRRFSAISGSSKLRVSLCIPLVRDVPIRQLDTSEIQTWSGHEAFPYCFPYLVTALGCKGFVFSPKHSFVADISHEISQKGTQNGLKSFPTNFLCSQTRDTSQFRKWSGNMNLPGVGSDIEILVCLVAAGR